MERTVLENIDEYINLVFEMLELKRKYQLNPNKSMKQEINDSLVYINKLKTKLNWNNGTKYHCN
ncbi:MAG: hypothetical protein ACOCVF_00885 [bacterium]